jgi:DNA repair ATPase RecN
MTNPYQAWNAANKALNDINEICKALNYCLDDLEVTPFAEMAIQGFLLQIAQAIQDYTQSVRPLVESYEALMEKK